MDDVCSFAFFSIFALGQPLLLVLLERSISQRIICQAREQKMVEVWAGEDERIMMEMAWREKERKERKVRCQEEENKRKKKYY